MRGNVACSENGKYVETCLPQNMVLIILWKTALLHGALILHGGFSVSNKVHFTYLDDGNKRHSGNILLVLRTSSLFGRRGTLGDSTYVSYIQEMEDGEQCQALPTFKWLL